MDTLIIEDFRCFKGRQEVPIRPLTLLVGENSTGKTSFLAAVRATQGLLGRGSFDFNEDPFNFNEDPFKLGSYDQIANYHGGRAGRAKSFTIGKRFASVPLRPGRTRRQRKGTQVQTEARFRSLKDQPSLASLSVGIEEYSLNLDIEEDGWNIKVEKNGTVIETHESGDDRRDISGEDYRHTIYRAMREHERTASDEEGEDGRGVDLLYRLILYSIEPRAYAFAPIRTSPRRTYDPTTEVRDPEGSHIPMMLERLLGNGGGTEFRDRLEKFGADSSLYSKLTVRKLGRKGSDPFQIEVKQPVGGRARNLIDVGYGVSQAIPIIADCVSAELSSTLLIQQPEVHLHPRAQAAMGSFFVQLAASERNRLVVETHSDYLLDRVRMDVRGEKIGCGDVMILYFEQDRQGVHIHPISLDAAGNLQGVPDGYRHFFLEEQRRFLGVD